jgi:hypothetical protein
MIRAIGMIVAIGKRIGMGGDVLEVLSRTMLRREEKKVWV